MGALGKIHMKVRNWCVQDWEWKKLCQPSAIYKKI